MKYTINSQNLWQHHFPKLTSECHKYTRGHTLVMGGPRESTGAARLSATAALRIGSGLVSVVCDESSLPIYAAALMSVMTKCVSTQAELDVLLTDSRITSLLIGPGCGVNSATQQKTLSLLATQKPCVLDADALTVFAGNSETLFVSLHENVVLTPHEGEFARLFSIEGTREKCASAAAKLSGAVVVLKGAHTIIAAPDGRTVMNDDAPAWLATAGSGDVLAGMIAGLMAQGMNSFDAACAAVWLHGKAASFAGLGMISEDLLMLIPKALQSLAQN